MQFSARTRLGSGALALMLAACSDSQAPDGSGSPTQGDGPARLPVLASAEVVAPAANPTPSGYTITLRFINTPTALQRTRFEDAKARWERSITGDVPDVSGVIPARTCGSSFATPVFNGTVDDILIDVLLQPIDGPLGILGAAGPCLVRSADNLTVYGLMFFDVDDLDFIESLGFFDEVVEHEMGHVLGFGTLWNFGRSLLQGAGTADPRFVGPLAVAAYDRLGGSGTVPVEGEFGPGTRDSHWDEDAFYNELMTGFLNAGARTNPLSDLSIAAMGDLGYVVALGSGDNYHLPRPLNADVAAKAVAGQVRDLELARHERLLRPVARVQ